MSQNANHSDDEEIFTFACTWGRIKEFLADYGEVPTDVNAEALLAALGNGDIEIGMDSLFGGACDVVDNRLHEALGAELPDKPWYDRPNGRWVYDREEPAGHHDTDENEPWYGRECHIGERLTRHGRGQERCCNTCSQCGRHVCERHTARCFRCGSIVCSEDTFGTPAGEWECAECHLGHITDPAIG